MNDELNLPPLPEPAGDIEIDCGPYQDGPGRLVEYVDGYTADQMREAIKNAVEADRKACAEKAKEIVERRLRNSSDVYGTADAVLQAISARR